MSSNEPLFSIVTVCFNSSATIAETIRSVATQNIDSALFEQVFVDGGSKDNTLDIIRADTKHPYQLHSGPDAGIYDAMNKGIALAKGRWLCFLNSDDSLASTEVLQQISQAIQLNPESEFIYGKVTLVQDGIVIGEIGKPIEPNDYWYPCSCMCHQGVFFRKDLFNRHGLFEVGVRGGISDYIWFARYFHAPMPKALFVNTFVSHFAEDGYSLTHVWEAYESLLDFAKKFFPWSIRIRFYAQWPKKFIKFKVLRLHQDTQFRTFYRKVMRTLFHKS